jgi:hypothetical protein
MLLYPIGQIEKDIAGDIRIAHGTIPNQIEKDVRELRDFVILRV